MVYALETYVLLGMGKPEMFHFPSEGHWSHLLQMLLDSQDRAHLQNLMRSMRLCAINKGGDVNSCAGQHWVWPHTGKGQSKYLTRQTALRG